MLQATVIDLKSHAGPVHIIKSHMSVSQTTFNMLAEFAQQMHDHKSPRCDSLLTGSCSILFISVSFYFNLCFIKADVAEVVLIKFIVCLLLR